MRLLKIFGANNKPAWAAPCYTAHIDKKGRRYYIYRDELDMCVYRHGEIEKCLLELRYGSDHTDIAEAMKKAFLKADKKGRMLPDFTQISYLAQEIIDRSEMLLIPDILFRLCANTLIREDENPYIVDQEILQEKISTFKQEIQRGGLHAFFLGLGWLKLIGLPNISPTGFRQYMENSEDRLNLRKRIIEAFISVER